MIYDSLNTFAPGANIRGSTIMKIANGVVLFIIFFCFCACSNLATETSEKPSLEYSISDEYSVWTYTDGHLICEALEDPVRIIELDIEKNNEAELGRISNFVLHGYSKVEISGKLFTSVAVADDNGELSNILYEIDYKSNSLHMISADKGYSPIVYLYKEPRGILQLKTPKTDSSENTFFELFNVTTAESEIVLIAQEHEIYIIASVYQKKLYVLAASEKDASSYQFYMKVYDIDSYSLIDEINLESINAYLLRSRIGKMEVFGDYVYLQNYSNEGVIYCISKSNVSPVIERENLEYAGAPQSDRFTAETLFYIRGTAECFSMNQETGEIHTINPGVHDNYEINCVFVDENSVLMIEKQLRDNKSEKPNVLLTFYDYDTFRSG